MKRIHGTDAESETPMDAAAAEVAPQEEMTVVVDIADGPDATVFQFQFRDAAGATHVIRDPERCLVYYPTSRRFTLERGSRVEQESKLGGVTVMEGADDAEASLVDIIALRLAEQAKQHDLQVFRVANSGNGPAVAAALRNAGHYVVEFAG